MALGICGVLGSRGMYYRYMGLETGVMTVRGDLF